MNRYAAREEPDVNAMSMTAKKFLYIYDGKLSLIVQDRCDVGNNGWKS